MAEGVMRAWAVDTPGPMKTHPLAPVRRAVPEPGAGQVRVRVSVCGVCRTDLHLAEGDLRRNDHWSFPATRSSGGSTRVGPDVQPIQSG